ncbi:hypothetical protein NL676_028045 [Syzygium grande]|nr:hypothetical protein NL676_028045 [Syzygium grande]
MATNQDPPARRVLPYRTARLEDHFSLGKELGKDQFGTAYLCTHEAAQELYACKSIPKWKLLCWENRKDVRMEIYIMHHLSEHPNVVQIKGTINQQGHFSEHEAAKVIKMIVGAVEACHSAGVMHRDVKPENLLFVTTEDDAKLNLIDFGLSVFCKPGGLIGIFAISFLGVIVVELEIQDYR